MKRFLFFSNQIRRTSSYLPHYPIKEPSFPSISHFSSIPNRPMRGANQRRQDDVTSDDHFLRNLNFENKSRNPQKTHQNPTPRFPNRAGRRPNHAHQGLQPLRETPFADEGKSQDFGDTLSISGDKDEILVSEEKGVEVEEETMPKDANEIFNKMKETGLIPNVVAMLDGLCKEGQTQEAMKLFGLMREKKTIPEVVVFTAVVEGFCKAGKFDDAKRVFRKMQTSGVVPNLFSYFVAIQGFCGGKRLEDAVEFCREMLDAGLSPNAGTIVGLVDLFVREKGGEEAGEFVRSLRERGFAIDEKAVREYLNKKGPSSSMVWEAFLGKKSSQRPKETSP